jgi:ABC-type sugar transport system ATPase subunit
MDGTVLEVADLSAGPATGIGFTLTGGEILGLAGLEGSGQSDILRAILGDLRPRAGRIRLSGRPGPRSAAEAWEAGVAYVPRERRREGLMLRRGIAQNVVLPHLSRFSRAGFWSRPGAERAEAEARGREVRLKYDRIGQSVATLSGGNQQKVLFARAISGAPKLALLDEPTRGVDVGAREDIYAMIRRLGASGTAVVMASSDLPELIGMCDRILVLRGGAQAGIVPTGGLTSSHLLAMIYGDRAVEAVA